MPLLLCDLDDTLVSRASMFCAWATSYLVELGAPADDVGWFVEIDDQGLRPRDDFFRQVIDRYALDETVKTMGELYHHHYITSFRCDPGVVAALGRVRRAGVAIGIVTNGDGRSQGAKIEAAGLADLVDACCISGTEGFWKPAPELFVIAAERCRADLGGGWMIGDNPTADIGGAVACGLQTVWMRQGRLWPPELDYRPTGEADSFAEAADFVLGRL